MKVKPVTPRHLAHQDIDNAVSYLLEQNSRRAALGLIDALEEAFKLIGRHPATGSSRYAHELGLEQLRSWPIKRHPYVIFYIERENHIDVWRVLHTKQHIPSWLIDSETISQ